jgi:hypothetical protein
MRGVSMNAITKKMTIFLLVLFFFAVHHNLYAQKCGLTTYMLDVESTYNKSDNNIIVYVTNPKPLKSDGKELNLTEVKISIYQGKEVIGEKSIDDFTIKPGEKKELKIDNLTENFGKDIVSVVVSGKTSGTPKLEVGSFNISLGKSVPTGVACGDDVLTY